MKVKNRLGKERKKSCCKGKKQASKGKLQKRIQVHEFQSEI